MRCCLQIQNCDPTQTGQEDCYSDLFWLFYPTKYFSDVAISTLIIQQAKKLNWGDSLGGKATSLMLFSTNENNI